MKGENVIFLIMIGIAVAFTLWVMFISGQPMLEAKSNLCKENGFDYEYSWECRKHVNGTIETKKITCAQNLPVDLIIPNYNVKCYFLEEAKT
ncbi:unnamed protein product [marine sediment metagenome]|uniref:Uncharacterized protein n=1 Tax=marine sediment metagenome TaxID=412755 RepID=X1GLW9_9ZZZZ